MRNATLDHARLWAAFGIVLFHAGAAGSAIGYAALPFFLMLLMVLAVPAAERMGFAAFARNRAERLLVPWAIWSAVYGGLKLAEAVLTARPLASEFSAAMLLTGPAIHLWFLPFAFVACLAVYPLARWPQAGRVMGNAAFGLGFAAAAGLALAALALRQGSSLPAPLAQWAFALPGLLLGLGLALARGQPARLALAAAGALAAGGAALGFGWTEGLLQLALATAALLACLAIRSRETAASRASAQLAMGVYLGHPLVASVLQRGTDLAPDSLAMVGLTIAGALGLTLGLAWLAAPATALMSGLRPLRLQPAR